MMGSVTMRTAETKPMHCPLTSSVPLPQETCTRQGPVRTGRHPKRRRGRVCGGHRVRAVGEDADRGSGPWVSRSRRGRHLRHRQRSTAHPRDPEAQAARGRHRPVGQVRPVQGVEGVVWRDRQACGRRRRNETGPPCPAALGQLEPTVGWCRFAARKDRAGSTRREANTCEQVEGVRQGLGRARAVAAGSPQVRTRSRKPLQAFSCPFLSPVVS